MEIGDAQQIIMDESAATTVYLCDEQVWPKETGVTKVYIEYDTPDIYNSKIGARVYSDIKYKYLTEKSKSRYAVTFDGVATKDNKIGMLYLSTSATQNNAEVVKFDGANIPMKISVNQPVFSDAPKLEEIKFTNLSAINSTWNVNMNKFFYNTPKLKVLEIPKNATKIRPLSAEYPFYNCGLDEIDLQNFVFSACTSLEGFCEKTEIFPKLLNFGVMQTNRCKNFKRMFYENSQIVKEYKTTIENFVTTSATTMNSMFSYCEKFDLDLSGWDVSHVTDFTAMFSDVGSFTDNKLDISTWDTSNATTMKSMFYGRTLHFGQIDLTKFNTSNVTDIAHMFGAIEDYDHRYQPFDLDLSGWDVSKVTSADGIFYSDYFDTLNLTGWHLTNIDTDVQYPNYDMFLNATINTIILKNSDEKTINYIKDRAMVMNTYPQFITE